jgi:AbrB family looped-hinge helix DNA binding protein
MNATVVIGAQGRVVIPAAIRERLGLQPGDRLNLRLSGTQLVLERPSDALTALRRFGSTVPPARALVDELLAERRAAAALE